MSMLGIGAGKIEMRLNRGDLHPGETVEGTAMLTMNEEVKARGVIASFWAERTEGSGKHRHTVMLHREDSRLDAERIYSPHEGPKQYSFSFNVPRGILDETPAGGGLVGGFVGWLKENSNNGIRWYVEAKLDVPMAFDVSKREQLRVTLLPYSAGQIRN